jgi:carboxypeptidase Taq
MLFCAVNVNLIIQVCSTLTQPRAASSRRREALARRPASNQRRLLSGELAVKDLRDAWNTLSSDRLGLVPASDLEGCLQDIHWAIGSFGHFPSYGVGAVIAGQLWETIREELPGIEDEIATGQFGGLLAWLRERVHAMGASLGVPPLVQHATGRPLSAASSLRYLERKYLAET